MVSINDKNILVGVTGGIAAYKSAELVRRLRDRGAVVRVVMTEGAEHFITALTMQAVSGHPVRRDFLNSDAESGMDHIELARWADRILVAPATADFIARLAGGHADDLLSTICLASEAPVYLAPAMNRVMWSKAVTQRNISTLIADGLTVLGPGSGDQACGESGEGRMLDVPDLVDAMGNRGARGPGSGHEVLITAGPTFEPLDPVRGLTNTSSGKMGYALASAFLQIGAAVTLVTGPCCLTPPAGARVVNVRSALEMHDAVHAVVEEHRIFVAVAAVADYRPKRNAEHKVKKDGGELVLTLVPNPDILASVASLPQAPFCVGFAAETQNVRDYAAAKLKSKKLDMIAANLVGENIGFNSDENSLLVLAENFEQNLGPASKIDVARGLRDLILERYEQKHTT